jgi:hypothetical protein
MKTVFPEINLFGTIDIGSFMLDTNLDLASRSYDLEDHSLSIILVSGGRPLLIQEARKTSWNILIEEIE